MSTWKYLALPHPSSFSASSSSTHVDELYPRSSYSAVGQEGSVNESIKYIKKMPWVTNECETRLYIDENKTGESWVDNPGISLEEIFSICIIK